MNPSDHQLQVLNKKEILTTMLPGTLYSKAAEFLAFPPLLCKQPEYNLKNGDQFFQSWAVVACLFCQRGMAV
jgi:hypothetical protein